VANVQPIIGAIKIDILDTKSVTLYKATYI